MKTIISALLLGLSAATAVQNQERSVSGTATVNLASNIGTPKYLASGFIYGIPDTANQIPDHFYTDIKFNYCRAGGAQVGSPGRGWIHGLTEYKNRFASVLSNYQTTRKYGGNFIFLVHDLWGADGGQGSSATYPGDNGDWSSWDSYMTNLISDIKANNMLPGLNLDIWNEPNLSIFWNRPQAQWIQLWGRAYHRFRSELPSALISGPSLASSPGAGDTWWTNWEKFIASDNSAPDQYSWHMEGGGGDMQSTTAAHTALLNTYGLAAKQVNINEYATSSEQVPSGGAWWIAQLERVNAIGLRGNWLSSGALHDFMAGLLGKPNAGTSSYNSKAGGYWAAAEFQVYKYYAQMTGYRVATLPTADKHGDVYAVVGSDKVRLLVGSRLNTGSWNIRIDSLGSVGLPTSGTLNIQTWGFQGNANNHYAEYDAPTNLGIVGHTYSGGSLTFAVNQADTTTGYAFEFSVSGGGQPTTMATTTKPATTNPATTTPGTVAQYGQCAGYGWTGGTTCCL
ncbi:hypothetical protein V490_08070 [Pseudogymnoascus sp. VKM F-3557]|nr:hypothetical protein V490_08070 [Pseudogymnoascus sp. VKM F-3557]